MGSLSVHALSTRAALAALSTPCEIQQYPLPLADFDYMRVAERAGSSYRQIYGTGLCFLSKVRV